MHRTFTWGFEADELADISRIRISVRTVTLREVGQRQAMVREIHEHYKEQFGDAKTTNDVPADLVAARNSNIDWAALRVATTKIEIRRVNEKNFETVSLEDLGWADPETALDIPSDLFNEWYRRVIECNPGVFGNVPSDPKEKKANVGLISIA